MGRFDAEMQVDIKRKRKPYSFDWGFRFNFFATVIAKKY